MTRIATVILLTFAAGANFADAKPVDAPPPPKPFAGKIVELKVFPDSLTLGDKFDARKVHVSGKTPEGVWVDLNQAAKFELSQPGIVGRDEDGFFIPHKDGKLSLKVSAAGLAKDLPVTVSGLALKRTVSFLRDVMPVLAKADCNAGACHGAEKGKNGFKLSLRGYDPEWDHIQLVDDLSSRRFNRSRPHDSLMLLKPTQEVPHQGNFRFSTDSLYYRILAQWIAEGNKSDVGKVTRAESITVYPENPTIPEPAMTQDFVVLAKYPDGKTRDVTKDAVYMTSQESIAKIEKSGRVQGLRRGESAVIVRYEGIYAVNYVSVLGDRPGYQWVETPANNEIDTLVYAKLQKMKLLPSPLCTDAEFIRRAYLDIIGATPSPEETRAFLNDKSPTKEKRSTLIEALLDRPEFVDRWTNKWSDLLQCNRKHLGEKGVWSFHNWIRNAVATNKPMDQFVRELVSASGGTFDQPAASYYRVSRDPLTALENTTQLFLGTRFSCNKCHDHPFERWTQGQYYQLGAFFGEVGRKPGLLPDEEVIFDRRDGGEAVVHPRTGAAIAPRFPFDHAGKVRDKAPRQQTLADWIVAPENPYFAKSIVNRFWSYFLGIGIIDPVNDIRSSNPPTNAELLDFLAKDFVAHKFDMKRLMRTICNSRTYQLSIESHKFNDDDKINFSHAMPRRLTAEQLQDAISVALDVPARYPGLPVGFRASQLPDTQVQSDFMDLFGRPPRESSCECERAGEVSLKQALNLVNGPAIGDAVADQSNRVARIVQKYPDNRQVIAEIYLACLCRLPSDSEVQKAAAVMAPASTKLEGAQDLAWALLNSPAFLFNR